MFAAILQAGSPDDPGGRDVESDVRRAVELIGASGDAVAADLVGLGLIKSHGKWDLVTGKAVGEQRQIRHARKLGIGVPVEEIELATDGRGEDFARLMASVREAVGI